MQIDYITGKEVLVWVNGGRPSVHEISLYEEEGQYNLILKHLRGTSVMNYTNEEIERLKEVLHITDLKLDTDNIICKHRNVYKITVLI